MAAAVGGIVAGRLGGAPLQVSGPTAGLTVVTAGLIQHYGWRTTCAITVLAGCCQLGLAFLRTARSALLVSPAIMHGMLAGIGVTIALAQLHIVLGGTPQSSAVANVLGLPAQLADLHPAALGVSALTLCVLLLWPRIPGRVGRALRKVPAALAAVAAATAGAALAGLDLPRVDLPSWSSHALPELPQGPVLGIIAAVLTITLVGSVESLMSSVATDKLIASERGTGDRPPRADLDRELRGQGAANIVSGMLGGLPVAAVAVRSAANVKSGAVSRKSAMLHGLWVVLAAGLLVPVLDLIPLAALAALVLAVGIQVVSITHLRTVTRYREVLVYAATIVAVVLGGVLEGVAVGIAVAVALAMHRLARTRITLEEADGVHRVRARGQLTFLAVPRLSRVLNSIPHEGHAVVELDGSFIDHAAYEILQDWQDTHLAHGGSVELTGRGGAAISRGNHARPAGTAPRAGAGVRPGHGSPTGSGRVPPAGAPRSAEPAATGAKAGERTSAAARGPPGRTTATTAPCPPRTRRSPRASRRARRPGRSRARPSPAMPGRPPPAPWCGSTRQRDRRLPAGHRPARPRRAGPAGARGTAALAALPHLRGLPPGDQHDHGKWPRRPLHRPQRRQSGPPARSRSHRRLGRGGHRVRRGRAEGRQHHGVRALRLRRHAGPAELPPGRPDDPLRRWLRHGLPSLERMASRHHAWARIAGRLPADAVEQLCLTNVVQQLDHLRAHESVARRLADGSLELHGMYFHVGEAQAYLLSEGEDFFDCRVFDSVGQNA